MLFRCVGRRQRRRRQGQGEQRQWQRWLSATSQSGSARNQRHLLVFGLGNDGSRFDGSRHNVGFACVDQLHALLSDVSATDGGHGDVALYQWRQWRSKNAKATLATFSPDNLALPANIARVTLVKSHTFMNLSGQVLRALLKSLYVRPVDVLVAYDDVALPLGRVMLRARGGANGHNGVDSVAQVLGAKRTWARLRIGIGDALSGCTREHYVLGRFSHQDRARVADALNEAARFAIHWISSSADVALATNAVSKSKKRVVEKHESATID
jgi:peptidyl-tRNA hydrolase, PTH1 family